MTTIRFRDENIHLNFGRYKDSNLIALQAVDDDNFPYMVISVNIPFHTDKKNLMVVKNWSENEGIEQVLLDNNIITNKHDTVHSGYVQANVYEVNQEFLGDK